MSEVKVLEARVANLEGALLAITDLIMHLQPPGVQADLEKIMQAHFNASQTLGGFVARKFQKYDDINDGPLSSPTFSMNPGHQFER